MYAWLAETADVEMLPMKSSSFNHSSSMPMAGAMSMYYAGFPNLCSHVALNGVYCTADRGLVLQGMRDEQGVDLALFYLHSPQPSAAAAAHAFLNACLPCLCEVGAAHTYSVAK